MAVYADVITRDMILDDSFRITKGKALWEAQAGASSLEDNLGLLRLDCSPEAYLEQLRIYIQKMSSDVIRDRGRLGLFKEATKYVANDVKNNPSAFSFLAGESNNTDGMIILKRNDPGNEDRYKYLYFSDGLVEVG